MLMRFSSFLRLFCRSFRLPNVNDISFLLAPTLLHCINDLGKLLQMLWLRKFRRALEPKHSLPRFRYVVSDRGGSSCVQSSCNAVVRIWRIRNADRGRVPLLHKLLESSKRKRATSRPSTHQLWRPRTTTVRTTTWRRTTTWHVTSSSRDTQEFATCDWEHRAKFLFRKLLPHWRFLYAMANASSNSVANTSANGNACWVNLPREYGADRGRWKSSRWNIEYPVELFAMVWKSNLQNFSRFRRSLETI